MVRIPYFSTGVEIDTRAMPPQPSRSRLAAFLVHLGIDIDDVDRKRRVAGRSSRRGLVRD
jgi:hypothetical protein